jgi:hypothetical protein
MDKQTVFAKTDQGREALTSRPAGLGPRLRSLLIMVDGKRSVGDLDKLLGSEGAAAPLLDQLVEQGWIEGGAAAAPASPPVLTAVVEAEPAAPASAPAPLVEALPFADARRLVVRFINDQLGPMGETLAIRVEGCKTAADLTAMLPRIRDGLRNFKNSATVAQFDQEVAPRLPGA